MSTRVPRVSFVLPGGQKACLICVERMLQTGKGTIRPARRDRSRQQSYCRQHQTEYQREWRRIQAGLAPRRKSQPLLTPDEIQTILELRAAKPAGKHHAG